MSDRPLGNQVAVVDGPDPVQGDVLEYASRIVAAPVVRLTPHWKFALLSG